MEVARAVLLSGGNEASSVFAAAKKGEDKEVVKALQFKTAFDFIENICHVVQQVNKNCAKFRESINKQLKEEKEKDEQLIEEEELLNKLGGGGVSSSKK